MTEAAAFFARVLGVLDAAEISYFVTGSVAAMYYGESRMTRDIDIVVRLRYGDITPLCEGLADPEFYLDRDSAVRALREVGMFNAMDNRSGLKADFICVERSPFVDSRFERARRVRLAPGVEGWTASAEDVILNKLLFFKEGQSDKHLRDIGGMIKVSGASLDRAYLEAWADKLGVRIEWDMVKSNSGW